MSDPTTHYPLIGILGGMGPAATADFYLKIIAATPAQRDQDHIPVLIHAVPQIPDRSSYLLSGGDSPAPTLIQGARKLEAAGARLIVISCNTAHFWHQEIQRAVSIPVLHIVDCVLDKLHALAPRHTQRILKTGVLATAATLNMGLYQNHKPDAQVEWVIPDAKVIERDVIPGIHAVKAGDLNQGKTLLDHAAQALIQQGVEALVYGCTEIPLVLKPYPGIYTLDATQLLAECVVQWVQQHKVAVV